MARGVLMMLLCNLVGGLTYPWQKKALQGLPPATVSALRTLFALLAMGIWLSAREGGLRWPWNRRETGRLAVVGIAGLALPLLLGTWGVDRSTAANGGILILLEPVSILVFSHLLLGEKVGGLRGAGVGLGLVGALCVIGEGLGKTDLLAHQHLAGNLMLAGSAVLWGLYSPVIAPLTRNWSGVELGFATLLFAQALFLPAAAVEFGSWDSRGAGGALLPALGYTLLLAFFASFLSTVLWNDALKVLPAPVVAPFVLLQPVVAVAAGVVVLDEELTRWAVAGAGFATAGVVLVLVGERRAARAAARAEAAGDATSPPR